MKQIQTRMNQHILPLSSHDICPHFRVCFLSHSHTPPPHPPTFVAQVSFSDPRTQAVADEDEAKRLRRKQAGKQAEFGAEENEDDDDEEEDQSQACGGSDAVENNSHDKT